MLARITRQACKRPGQSLGHTNIGYFQNAAIMLIFTLSRRLCLAFLALLCAGAQAQAVFRLGVAPHTSARMILEMYQPLRLLLENALGMPVEVVTAPDFTEFARRMLHQDYDIAITTGHQALLGQSDAGYSPPC